MSERARQQVITSINHTPAQILEAGGLVVPESLRTATALGEPTEALPTIIPRANAYASTTLTPSAGHGTAWEVPSEPQENPEKANRRPETLADVPANASKNTSRPATLADSSGDIFGSRGLKKPEDWTPAVSYTEAQTKGEQSPKQQKRNPLDYYRGVMGRLAANIPQEKLQAAKRYGKIATGVGVVAAAAYTVYSLYAAKNGIQIGNVHIGGNGGPTWNQDPAWHDGATAAPDNNVTAPDSSHVSPSTNQHDVFGRPAPSTDGPAQPTTETTPTPKPELEHHDTYKTAVSHDSHTGRASNVTDWSRQTIYSEAKEAGLTNSQATALSHDQHNINSVNKGFYHDNAAVGRDNDHTIFAGHKYKMNGAETAADRIIDNFKAEHGIDTPATTPQAAGSHESVQQVTTATTTDASHAPTQTPSAAPTETTPQTIPTPDAQNSTTLSENNNFVIPEATYEPSGMTTYEKFLISVAAGLGTIVTGAAINTAYQGRKADAEARRRAENKARAHVAQHRAQQTAEELTAAAISQQTENHGRHAAAEDQDDTTLNTSTRYNDLKSKRRKIKVGAKAVRQLAKASQQQKK